MRREIEELAASARNVPQKRAREFRKATFMLSGSVLGRTGRICTDHLPYHVEVVGIEGPSTGHVTFHGKVLDNISLLAESDLLLVNAGFSAVSEALALRKPTIVVPVARHAEQYVNACRVVELGYGAMLGEGEVGPYLQHAYESNAFIGRGKGRAHVDSNGAAEAAEIIFAFLRGRRAPRNIAADVCLENRP